MRSSTNLSRQVINTTDQLTTPLNTSIQSAFMTTPQGFNLPYYQPHNVQYYNLHQFYHPSVKNNPFAANITSTQAYTPTDFTNPNINANNVDSKPVVTADDSTVLDNNSDNDSSDNESDNDNDNDSSDNDSDSDSSDNESDNDNDNIPVIIANPTDVFDLTLYQNTLTKDDDYKADYQAIFVQAVLDSDHQKVAKFVRHVDAAVILNPGDYLKTQAIHRAADAGDVEMLKALLEIENNPNAHQLIEQENFFSQTALFLAAEKKHRDAIIYLLKKGANSQAILNPQNMEYLNEAIIKGDEELLKALIENFVRKTSLNDHFALYNHGQEYYFYLAALNSDANYSLSQLLNTPHVISNFTPLMLAAKHNHAQMISYLIEHGANPNVIFSDPNDPKNKDNGKTPLQFALESKHSEAITILLENSVVTSSVVGAEYFSSGFRAAYINKNIKTIVTLLKAGCIEATKKVDPKNPNSLTFIHQAIMDNDIDMVKALIEYGPKELLEQKDTNQTPLLRAAINNCKDIVSYLLSKGANVDAVDAHNQTSLMWAAANGHKEIVECLLQNKANIHAKSKLNRTALHGAFKKDQLETIALLVQNGADAALPSEDVEDKLSLPFLHQAIQKNDLPMVKALIENNPQAKILLNQKDRYNQTPLMRAAIINNIDMLTYLLQQDADLNIVFQHPSDEYYVNNGKTAFHLIYTNWRQNKTPISLIELLVKKGADITRKVEPQKEKSPSFLHEAAQNGKLEIVKILLEGNPSLATVIDHQDALQETALLKAAAHGHTEVVDYLLKMGAKTNVASKHPTMNHADDGMTPLAWALRKGHMNIVAALLNHKPVTQLDKSQAWKFLYEATEKGRLDIIETLFAQNPDLGTLLENVNENNETPLLLAAKKGFNKIVTYLLTQGANPNVLSKDKKTALHYVFKGKDADTADTVAALVQKGADTTLANENTLPCLHRAIIEGKLDVVKALIENNPQAKILLNQKDRYNPTPLMCAAIINNIDILTYLLQQDTDPNIVFQHPSDESNVNNGKTAFHLIYTNWRQNKSPISLIELLVKKGADITRKVEPQKEESPSFLHEAAQNGKLEIVKILLEGNPSLATVIDHQDTLQETALLKAAANGHTEVVDYLLKMGAKTNVASKHPTMNHADDGMTPLAWALRKGHTEVVKTILIYEQQPINLKEGASFVHQAIQLANLDILELLFANNPELNALLNQEDQHRDTFLWSALEKNNPEIITYLLKKGADVNTISKENTSPLHFAYAKNNKGLIATLVTYGADVTQLVNPKDPNSLPFIHQAVEDGDLAMVKAMLKTNLNIKTVVEVRNHLGQTPILLAGRNGNNEIVDYLYKKGAINYYAFIETYADNLEKELSNELRSINKSAQDSIKYKRIFVESIYSELQKNISTDFNVALTTIAKREFETRLYFYSQFVPKAFKKDFRRIARVNIEKSNNWENDKTWKGAIKKAKDLILAKVSFIRFLQSEYDRVNNDKFNFLNDKTKTQNKLWIINRYIDTLNMDSTQNGINTIEKLNALKDKLSLSQNFNQNRSSFNFGLFKNNVSSKKNFDTFNQDAKNAAAKSIS